jgi:adenylate kinase family enzyme
MRRVMVIGSGGAGKSTFALRLGALLGLPVIHLDAQYWGPGWVEPPKDAWRRKVEELVCDDEWVVDGNYSGTLDVRLAACDTVIFLDLPRVVCIWRVLKRLVTYRNGRRPDMAEGCREKLNFDFLLWIWNYPSRTRPKVVKLLKENSENKRVVRLRSRSEVEEFLAGLKKERREEVGGV